MCVCMCAYVVEADELRDYEKLRSSFSFWFKVLDTCVVFVLVLNCNEA